MATVNIRYFVNDVDAAIAFYTTHLGFGVERQPAPGFAILSRGELRLLLSALTGPGGAAQPMPDGRKPEPGGWNRIQLEVDDLQQSRGPTQGRRPFPQRHRHWLRWQADPSRRPFRESYRTLRTATGEGSVKVRSND